MVKLGGLQHRLWLWWWEGKFLPDPFLGRELMWSINQGGPVSWPGRIRCLFRPHADDSYGCCCYCGAWQRDGKWVHR